MGIKYSIIVKDENPDKNIGMLTPVERVDQAKICLSICTAIINYGDVDEINKPLVEYCSTRFLDLLQYTLKLIYAVSADGNDMNQKAVKNLEKFERRIKQRASKIAPYFNADTIDWKYISTL